MKKFKITLNTKCVIAQTIRTYFLNFQYLELRSVLEIELIHKKDKAKVLLDLSDLQQTNTFYLFTDNASNFGRYIFESFFLREKILHEEKYLKNELFLLNEFYKRVKEIGQDDLNFQFLKIE